MQYFVLFLEGIITFISPCMLPMLPIYISFFTGGSEAKNNPFKVLFNAIGFVMGFSIVFILLGAFAGTLGKFLNQYSILVNIVSGLIIIIFGLNYLGLFKILFLNKTVKINHQIKNINFFSAILFGIVFAIGWTPCVGTFLGTALMLASQTNSALTGIVMLMIYSLGLGLPFIISAVLIDRLKGTINFIKRNYTVINYISGGFLVLLGILIMTGYMGRFLALLSF